MQKRTSTTNQKIRYRQKKVMSRQTKYLNTQKMNQKRNLIQNNKFRSGK